MNPQTSAPTAKSPWSLWSWKNMLALFIVLAGVGGITFMTQWVASDGDGNDKRKEKTPQLVFREPVVAVQEIDEMYPSTGGHDFWFTNPGPEPMEISLIKTSCKCQSVQLLVLEKDEAKHVRGVRLAAALVGQAGLGAPAGLAPIEAIPRHFASYHDEASWQTLKEGETIVPIPVGCTGSVRMNWQGRREGPERLRIAVGTRLAGQTDASAQHTLEIPVLLVKPVRVTRRELDFDMLNTKSEKQTTLLVFSSTRESFDIKAAWQPGHPCFSVDVRPLTEAERIALEAKGSPRETVARSGYLVTVKVKERTDDAQLDLGPFHQRLEISSNDLPEPYVLDVYGSVLGEIRLATNDKQRLELGEFDVRAGNSVEDILIGPAGPALKLVVESKTPKYLNVDLKETGETNRWKVKVTVPPNQATGGRLPRSSSIVLVTEGASKRRIRIPVTGHATN